jgi:hypothetical protein
VTVSEVQPWPAGAWQRLLAEAVTRADELIEAVGVSPDAGGGPSTAAAERQFGVRVPRGFAKRIRLRPADYAVTSPASSLAFSSGVTRAEAGAARIR